MKNTTHTKKVLTVLALIGLAGCIALFIPAVRSAIIYLGGMAKMQILHRATPFDAVKWNRWLIECAGAGTFFLGLVLFCNTRIFTRISLLLQQNRQTDNSGVGNASIAGFCNFCKENVPLVIAVTFALFFTYGIKLSFYSIGIDTEGFITSKNFFLPWNIQIGRFGLGLLQKLWYIKEFNPCIGFLTGLVLFGLATLSWCYVIGIFSKNTKRNNNFIPFVLVFTTSPVWAEHFYFVFQAAETAFIIGLSPYVIYFLYRGFLDNQKAPVIAGVITLSLMIAVYQAILPLFICGIFICFILLQEHSDYDARVYSSLCLKLFVALLVALALYAILDRLWLHFAHLQKSEYIKSMGYWGHYPLKSIVLGIIRHASRVVGENVSLLPAMIIFIGHIIAQARLRLPPPPRHGVFCISLRGSVSP